MPLLSLALVVLVLLVFGDWYFEITLSLPFWHWRRQFIVSKRNGFEYGKPSEFDELDETQWHAS